MLKVGLTGGVACGKSTVGEMLVAHGAHLVKADQIAHELMKPGAPVYEDIVRTFGLHILNSDGTISHATLADEAFGKGRIEELNGIVHPAVIATQEKWMEEIAQHDQNAVAVVEAALLLEANTWQRFDRIITVTCSFHQKVERFAARHQLSLETATAEVERRMAAQRPDEDKIAIAHYVIDNSGPLERTREQVDRVWGEIQQLAISS